MLCKDSMASKLASRIALASSGEATNCEGGVAGMGSAVGEPVRTGAGVGLRTKEPGNGDADSAGVATDATTPAPADWFARTTEDQGAARAAASVRTVATVQTGVITHV
jgi:hypothetical protein